MKLAAFLHRSNKDGSIGIKAVEFLATRHMSKIPAPGNDDDTFVREYDSVVNVLEIMHIGECAREGLAVVRGSAFGCDH